MAKRMTVGRTVPLTAALSPVILLECDGYKHKICVAKQKRKKYEEISIAVFLPLRRK
jgi:hypothetical protein